MTAAEDRQRIMDQYATGNGADRERDRAAAYQSYYADAAATRDAGVGSALAAGNVQDAQKAAASLDRNRNKFDSSYALEQAGDVTSRRAVEFARQQAEAKALAAQGPAMQPYVFDPNTPNPYDAFTPTAPPGLTGPALWQKLVGHAGVNAQSQIPGIGGLLGAPVGPPAPQSMQQQIAAGHPGHAVNAPTPWYNRLRAPGRVAPRRSDARSGPR